MRSQTVSNFACTGVGILMGYALFVWLWQTQCAELIQQREEQYNETILALRQDCAAAAATSTTAAQDLSQMQHLLEKQTHLATKYQDLLEKHEETLFKLSKVQSEGEGWSQIMTQLHDQIHRLQTELTDSTVQVTQTKQQAGKQLEQLQSQLELYKSMLRQKVQEVETLKATEASCAVTAVTGRGSTDMTHVDELVRLQGAIRRRNIAQCLMLFGEPPYRVEFTLDLPGPAKSFTVEFNQLDGMPHTILTFLTLVDAALYTGTALHVSADSIVGGDPQRASRQIQSTLTRQYAQLGFGLDPLWFDEVSPQSPCNRYSFGLWNRGPDIFVPLVGERSPVGEFMSRSCPGTVIHGMGTLAYLQEHHHTAHPVTIKNARILPATKEQTSTHEL